MHVSQDRVPGRLYVITTITNPARFKRRPKLYRDFQKHIRDSGATLITVEAALRKRGHELELHAPHQAPGCEGTTPVPQHADGMPDTRVEQDYIKLRTNSRIWLKENLINIGISHLPPDWEYAAWVDADVMFVRPDWVSETLHQLQKHPIVQMFSVAQDLSPKYEPIKRHRSFVWSWRNRQAKPDSYDYYERPQKPGTLNAMIWHPGFAWGFRRDFIDNVGRLIDWSIMGAGDRHMASALFGFVEQSVHPGVHPNYMRRLLQWQDRAQRYVQQNVGMVDGLIEHFWHGPKAARRYLDRWNILVDNHFDPELDLKLDWQGLWQLTDHNWKLRDDADRYFHQRNEDSIDYEEEGKG